MVFSPKKGNEDIQLEVRFANWLCKIEAKKSAHLGHYTIFIFVAILSKISCKKSGSSLHKLFQEEKAWATFQGVLFLSDPPIQVMQLKHHQRYLTWFSTKGEAFY